MAAAMSQSQLVVGVRQSEAGLKQLETKFWQVSDPAHPSYLQYLPLASINGMLAPTPEDIHATRVWMEESGMCDGEISQNVDTLHCKTSDANAPAPPPPNLHSVVDFVFTQTHGGSAAGARGFQTKHHKRKAGVGVAGTPTLQRTIYGIPEALKGTNKTHNLQMVWGPGTFGVNLKELQQFYTKYCTDCDIADVSFDTENHGTEPGDNFDEGSLDATYISTFGKGVRTLVSNTNTSKSTEEGEGQGSALLQFLNALSKRQGGPGDGYAGSNFPLVLSLSLGSLSSFSCANFCTTLAATTSHTYAQCHTFLQSQRQVCLFLDNQQTQRINVAFKVLALRGVTVVSASGDGGSHWSFGPFRSISPIAKALNKIGCEVSGLKLQ